jgi:hypothetical protein
MIMNGNGRLSECEEDRGDDTEMDDELDRGQRTHYPTFSLPSEGGDVGCKNCHFRNLSEFHTKSASRTRADCRMFTNKILRKESRLVSTCAPLSSSKRVITPTRKMEAVCSSETVVDYVS